VNGAERVPDDGEGRRRARSRHSTDAAGSHAQPAEVEPPFESAPAAAARHSTGFEPGTEAAPNTGGQSVAELLARLQTTPTEGRRRRRRED
jgi:hypothetical protein